MRWDSGYCQPENNTEKDIKQIFTKFYNSKSHPRCQSNGIGLSLTKELETLHHGNIKVSSELGKGSLFTVEKPIDREVYSEQEIVESSPLPVQDRETDISAQEEKPCILFIDDNKDLQELITVSSAKETKPSPPKVPCKGLNCLKAIR